MLNNNILTIEQIREITKQFFINKGIFDVYLFGSVSINEELEKAFNKKVDVIFKGSKLNSLRTKH